MRRTTSLTIILIALLTSCSYNTVPKYIKTGFAFRINELQTHSNLKLRIDGYYSNYHAFKRPIYSKPFDRDKITYESDTTYVYRVFFEDGSFLTGSYSSDTLLNQRFVEVINDNVGEKSKAFYTYEDWGLYKLSGDTIRVQYINRPSPGESRLFWYAYEECFIILDETTIQQIDAKPLHKMTEGDWTNWETNKKENKDGNIIDLRSSKYIQSKGIPSPNSWIKRQDWAISNGNK